MVEAALGDSLVCCHRLLRCADCFPQPLSTIVCAPISSLRSHHLNTSSTSQLCPGCLGSPSRLPHLSLCLRLRALRPPALHNLVSPSSITPHSPMGHGAVAEEQHHNMRTCAHCDVVLRRHPRHLPPLPLLSPQAAAGALSQAEPSLSPH